jgi:hypothetical protein
MSDESQIVVPPAFIALYLLPGRSKPSLPRDEIAARHEFCEDLASALTERAAQIKWDLGVSEADVLERIRRGLHESGSGIGEAEAGWVMGRLAELLDWPPA